MAERTYNGFTNRETWLVNVYYRESILENVTNGETVEGNLEYVKEAIKDRIDRHSALTSGIVQELICSKEIVEKINWLELASHYIEELEFQAKTAMHIDHEEFMKENSK